MIHYPKLKEKNFLNLSKKNLRKDAKKNLGMKKVARKTNLMILMIQMEEKKKRKKNQKNQRKRNIVKRRNIRE